MTYYRSVNESQYASEYWRPWPTQEVWLDRRIRLHLFTKWLRPVSSESFLDLGGGVGNFANRLSDYFTKTVLVDIVREALRQNGNPRIAKVQADILALPFQANTFHKVLLSDTLEHLKVTDIPSLLAEVQRVIRPDGVAVIFTSCRGVRLRPILLRVQGRLGRGELDWRDLRDGHLNRLRDRELSELVRAAGFRIRSKRFFSHVFEPLVTAVLEALRRRLGYDSRDGMRDRTRHAKHRLDSRLALATLTIIMALDLVLLGWMPGGGIFMAIEPDTELIK